LQMVRTEQDAISVDIDSLLQMLMMNTVNV
jgi:hypothetical protein